MWDVIVDLRPDSSTYRVWAAFELRADPGAPSKMVYLPPGFAHGFLTLTDDTEVFYQMSEFHAPAAARGFRWNDPAFAIDWPEPVRVISDRDRTYPDFMSRPTVVGRSTGGASRESMRSWSSAIAIAATPVCSPWNASDRFAGPIAST